MARIRGDNILDLITPLQAHRWAAAEFLSEELQSYLDHRIHRHKWYPEQDYLELFRILGKIAPAEHCNIWSEMGRMAVSEILEYRHPEVIHVDDPIETLRAIASLWEQNHDTGYMRVVRESMNRARLELRDHEAPAIETCEASCGYFSAALENCGARNVIVQIDLCITRGDEFCSWSADWTNPLHD